MRRNSKPPQRSAHPKIGLVEWFRPGEYSRVESVLVQARALGIRHLRTNVCWADWYTSEGDGWYNWLLPRLAQEVNILPCFLYTPPSLGIAPKFSSPPRIPKAYGDFIDVMITRFDSLFDWIELWDRPDSRSQWDSRMDTDWQIFSEMIGGAAYWIRKRGKKTVLPAHLPTALNWFDLMKSRGVLDYIDAVGIQGFPSTAELPWRSWDEEIGDVRRRLKELGSNAEVWITQTGFSTWRGDERAQVEAFVTAATSPSERVYWQGTFDRDATSGATDSNHSDEREFHYGLKRADGGPKLLFRLWSAGGLDAARDSVRQVSRGASGEQKSVLITGGAGFIGTNLANRLLGMGHSVTIYDNLSRTGVDRNLSWLRSIYGDKCRVELADVRDSNALQNAVRSTDQIFHLAAQVAVTTSVVDPRLDYEVNIGGSLNLLEAIRNVDDPPPLVYTSTNKVYGALTDVALQKNCTRYQPLDALFRTGVSEDRHLDFHSPYGCSKGAADQYVLDYARTFGLPTVVFRMSCIYGPHQMGTEDQGWVAHFLIRALHNEPILIFGDGMQVRDLLFVEDLVDAFLLAQANIDTLSGQAFNIGGGLGNTISLIELVDLITTLQGKRPEIEMRDWRTGDQRYYVSDTRRFKAATGWSPKVNVRQGVEDLSRWLVQSYGLSLPLREAERSEFHAVLAH
jgi:CDP-paratose 2-epimerase